MKPINKMSLLMTLVLGTQLNNLSWADSKLESFQTHSHLEFSVTPEVQYKVQPIQQKQQTVGLLLEFNNLASGLNNINSASDPRIKQLQVKQIAKDSFQVTLLFSEKMLKNGFEYFDYRSKTQNEIGIDFWFKKTNPEQAPKKVAEKISKTPKLVKAKTVNKITNKEELSVGCAKKLEYLADGRISFKVIHNVLDLEKLLALETADQDYKYPLKEIKKNENFGVRKKELAHYRLILKIKDQKEPALALRTLEFFEKQYANSLLKSEVKFLKANLLLELAKNLKTENYINDAYELLKQTILEKPDSERAKKAMRFLVKGAYLRKNFHDVLELALIGANFGPEGSEKDQYRLISAEAMVEQGDYARAERMYKVLIENKSIFKEQLTFQVGNLYAFDRFWERAAIAYELALKEYPQPNQYYPNLYLNLANAYYNLNQLAKSLEVYQLYLKSYDSHPLAWIAAYRVAELTHVLDPKSDQNVAKLYENVVNRYPFSPTAFLAEIRLASCKTNEKHSLNYFNDFFKSKNLASAKHALLDENEINIIFDLAEARFYKKVKMYPEALKNFAKYFANFSKQSLAPSFIEVYQSVALDYIDSLAQDSSNAASLIEANKQYKDLIVKPEPARYWLALATAYEHERKYQETQETLAKAEVLIKDASEAEKNRFHYLRYKNLKTHETNSEKLISELNQISDASSYVVFKYDELAKLYSAKKDFNQAIFFDSKLLNTADLKNKIKIDEQLKIAIRIAENHYLNADYSAAAKNAEQAILKYGTLTQYFDLQIKLKEILSLSLYETKQYQAAIDSIKDIIGLMPNHTRLNEFEFKRAKSLASLGREKEARAGFQKVAQASNSDIWKKSAQAELNQLQWEGNLQNFINNKDRRSSQ